METTQRLASGAELAGDQAIRSADGRFELIQQRDGNLVLYRIDDASTRTPLWASNTTGKAGARTCMQGDGNLVVISASGDPLWSSKTEGHPGATLELENDGLLTVRDTSGATLWTGKNVIASVAEDVSQKAQSAVSGVRDAFTKFTKR
jgi:hypothetical protein